jgi:V/A-type H+-transporting ATPase subunit I
VFDYLIFSLYIGVAQITFGISLDMSNLLIKRNVVDAFLVAAPKIAFYLSAVYLITVYKLNVGLWFSGPILLILVPFLFMVFAKPAFVAISHFSSMRPAQTELANEAGGGSLGVSLFESGDTVTRLLSNTISYTRILALLMAHWALILVTYTVAGLIGSASISALVLSSVVIIGGNLFVIALEGLIVFIHTMRLHFYEWFTKFYYDSGTEFSPFKQNFLYTEVSFKGKEP